MTPLANIALLLIVFFIWLKQLQQPVLTHVFGPYQCKCESYQPVSTSLFLLEQDKVGVLTYLPDKASAEFMETDYSVNGLRTKLRHIEQHTHSVVLIRPTAATTFKNLVDTIDELAINGRIQFMLEYDLTKGERQMLTAYQQYKKTNPKQSLLMHLPLYQKTSVSETK